MFICENNGYAISVPMTQESAVDDVADRAHSYGFGGVIVDGNDPLDVYAATHQALRRARAGDGPTLIECKTYRYPGPHLRRRRPHLPHRRGGRGVAEEGPAAPVPAVPDRAAPAARGRRGGHRGRAQGRGRRRRQAGRGPAVPVEPATATTKVFARPLRPVPGAPAGTDVSVAADAHAAEVPLDDAGPTTERNVIDTIRQTQHDLMAGDERVIVLGEDVGPRGGVFRATDGLSAAFGRDRVLDTPLAESSIVGIGIGLALAGLRPICEIQFADFIHSAYDQIASEAARLHYRSDGDFSVPMVIRAPWGGGVHGALYHSQSIEATYAHVPGLKVVAPSTPADVAGLLREAVADPDPVLFLEHKKSYRLIKGLVPDDPTWRVPIGVAAIARPGTDATVVTYGMHRHLAVAAADQLERRRRGLGRGRRPPHHLARSTSTPSSPRWPAPGRCLVVHEDNISFGVGAEVAALVAEHAFFDLDAPVRRLATADVPAFPFAPPLEEVLTIDAVRIAAELRALLDV